MPRLLVRQQAHQYDIIIMPTPKSRLHVTLDSNLKAALQRAAFKLEQTATSVLTRALRDYLKKQQAARYRPARSSARKSTRTRSIQTVRHPKPSSR